ncbi:MAG: hypothetical protein JWO11_3910 [Nocardioides sp.]|nr:hypothetical protein [Nocardioides sp.]
MLVDAMRDGAALARWAEPNTIALNDERVERAVLDSFSTRSEPGCAVGVPMLRPGDPDRLAVPLLDAIVAGTREFRAKCDRCHGRARPNHRLWVPAGATVAELVCCWLCRDVLNDVFSDLVWR